MRGSARVAAARVSKQRGRSVARLWPAPPKMSHNLKVVNCPSQVRVLRRVRACCAPPLRRADAPRIGVRCRTWRSATASSAMPWTRRRCRLTSRCRACAHPTTAAPRSGLRLHQRARSPNFRCARFAPCPATAQRVQGRGARRHRAAVHCAERHPAQGAPRAASRFALFTCPHADAWRPQLARVSAGDSLRVDDFAVPRKQFDLALLTLELEFVKSRGPGAPQEEVDAPSLVKQLVKRFQQQVIARLRHALQPTPRVGNLGSCKLPWLYQLTRHACVAGVHGGPEAYV